MKKRKIPTTEAYRLLTPGCVVLVASQKAGKYNVMAASWQMPISKRPPLVAVSIGRERLTAGYIQATGAFTINIPGYNLLSKVHYCGTVSGRNVDKFGASGLTPIPGQNVAAPLIGECLANVECRLWDTCDGGDHYIFVGEVVAAVAAPQYFENQWRFSGGKESFLLHHLGRSAYVVAGTLVNVLEKEGKFIVLEKLVGSEASQTTRKGCRK